MTIEEALKLKKIKGLNWDEFAQGLPIKGNSLRVAFNRKSVPQEYLEHIFNTHNEQSVQTAHEPTPTYGLSIDDIMLNKIMSVIQPQLDEIKEDITEIKKELHIMPDGKDQLYAKLRMQKNIEQLQKDVAELRLSKKNVG